MGRINKEIIRVAVVGAGRLAKSTHYPCLASIKEVEIAGWVGREEAEAEIIACREREALAGG